MISETLATILRSSRADFNARFVEARRRFPGLSGEAFSVVVRELVDPAVAAVAGIDTDGVGETASVAYDCALELAGQNLAGPGARSQAIAEGWRLLLPAAARHLAEAPRSVLPAISNALHHLATTPGARPDRWLHDMTRLASQCRDAAELLKLGQAAAWRAGMAHYRQPALALLATLPEELALELLEAPLPRREGGISDICTRLAQNRWYNPAKGEDELGSGVERLRPVARIGAFRGFGGLFPEPPRVAVSGTTILVRSGGECWQLTADCFGATFHRCDPALFAAAGQAALPAGLEIAGSTVRRAGFSLNLGQLGSVSSAAATADTLALTSPLTHAVMLVALT